MVGKDPVFWEKLINLTTGRLKVELKKRLPGKHIY